MAKQKHPKFQSLYPGTESVSIEELTKHLNLNPLDHTLSSRHITHDLERLFKQRVAFAHLLMAALFSGHAVVPDNGSFRYVLMTGNANANA